MGFTLDLLAILAGGLGMLCLLVLLFGRQAPIAPYAEPFVVAEESHAAPPDAAEPFIPMPAHLTTHAEMVAWMTQELPRLAEEADARSRRS